MLQQPRGKELAFRNEGFSAANRRFSFLTLLTLLHNHPPPPLFPSFATYLRSPKLIRALFDLYGTKYILIGVWKLIWAACTWAGAYYFLRVSIEFLEQVMPVRTGYLYAMGLLLTSLGSSIAIHQLYGQCTALGIQVSYKQRALFLFFSRCKSTCPFAQTSRTGGQTKKKKKKSGVPRVLVD